MEGASSTLFEHFILQIFFVSAHPHLAIQIMARVNHGKFSYDVDTFYVEASGHLHRRAIPAELKAIFDASIPDRNQRPDHPAHWFEAQLLHYGLPPSKVKATAKMRLLDAIQDDILEVPIELVQMEKRLKKEWKRQDTAARSLSSGLPHPTIDGTTSTTTTETTTRSTVTTSSSIPRKRGRDIEDEGVGERPSVKQTARRRSMGRASVQNNTTRSTAVQPQVRQRPELPNQARRRQGSDNTVPPLQTARHRMVGSGSGGHVHGNPSTASSPQQTMQMPGARIAANGNFDLSGRIGQIGIRSSTPAYRDDREMVSVSFLSLKCKVITNYSRIMMIATMMNTWAIIRILSMIKILLKVITLLCTIKTLLMIGILLADLTK